MTRTGRKSSPIYSLINLFLMLFVAFGTFAALTRRAATLTETNEPKTYPPVLSRTLSTGYRAYMEYSVPSNDIVNGVNPAYTCDILRQQKMYVYVKAGEKICLGSDIFWSVLDENDVTQDSDTGVDIVLISPDGKDVVTFDNQLDGVGYIKNIIMENAGANYDGNNPSGYTPHIYEAKQTGVYEVRFHSYSGKRAQSVPGSTNKHHWKVANDPGHIEIDNSDWKNTTATVGSYDITVVDQEGNVKSGRAFTNCLALNLGKNANSAIENVDYGESVFVNTSYIVTNDGYIYRCDMDLDPFGFLFFANNRGIIDAEGNSLYKSFKSGNNNLSISSYGAYIHDPNSGDTDMNKTHKIFFQEPDPELVDVLYPKAYEPETIGNVEFIGLKEDNITYMGCGGFFEFDVKNAVSVSVKIDFSTYNQSHNTDFQNVVIRSSVVPGRNSIFWDGLDGAGEVLPDDIYSSGEVKITVSANVGEVHFPLLDVENSKGFKLTRINNIYKENGELADDDDYDYDKTTIYYDNKSAKKDIADSADNTDGNISSLAFTMGKGDFTTIDVWKYCYSGKEKAMALKTDIVIIKLDEFNSVDLSAYVFLDRNNNSAYDVSIDDSPIEGVQVDLDYYYCETRWHTIKDDPDSDAVDRYDPIEIAFNKLDEHGDTVPCIYGYYSDYRVVPDENDPTKGTLYMWINDSLHKHEPQPVLDGNGEPLVVDIMKKTFINPEGVEQTDTIVWMPVHVTTYTDSKGKFTFTNILVNQNNSGGKSITDLSGDDYEKYNRIVVSVRNPNYELYGDPTTTGVTLNSDFSVNGCDDKTGDQIISLSALEQKVRRDSSGAGSSQLSYRAANVGYYYSVYYPPITVQKTWSNSEGSSSISEIVFTIVGADDEGNVLFTRDAEVNQLNGWRKELVNLPSSLNYTVVSERFTLNGKTYVCTNNSGSGVYTCTDVNGDPVTIENDPFTTYFKDMVKSITGDTLTIENLMQGTTSLTVTKTDIDHPEYRLKNATFRLYKKNGDGIYTEFYINSKVYDVTTGEDGKAVFHGLTEGEYRLVERVAPSGYDISFAKPIDFVISKTGDSQNSLVTGNYTDGYGVIFENYEDGYSYFSRLTISKINADHVPIDTAVFAMYPSQDGLYIGKKAVDDVAYIQLNDDNTADIPESGESGIYTTNVNTGTITVEINDVHYFIDPVNTADEESKPCFGSTQNGQVIFDNIPVGTYFVRELAAPDMYVCTPSAELITLKANQKICLDVVNESEPLSLTIKKINEVYKTQTVDGSRFALYYINENGDQLYYTDSGWVALGDGETAAVHSYPADTADSKVYSGLIADRDYYLIETQAPAGFQRPTEPVVVRITNNGATADFDGKGLTISKVNNSDLDYVVTIPNDYENKPSVVKYVKEDSTGLYVTDNSADYGQVCEFLIEAKVDGTNKNVSLIDSFRYTENSKTYMEFELTDDPIIVTVNGNDLPENSHTVSRDANGNGFTVSFKNEYIASLSTTKMTTISVKYTAKLKDSAVIREKKNRNFVSLRTYKGNCSASTYTYTYSFKVNKYNEENQPVSGASFILSRTEDDVVQYAQLSDSKLIGWVTDINEATPIVTPGNGKIEFKGLDEDTYQLIELSAPSDYQKLDAPIPVKVGNKVTYTLDGNSTATTDYTVPVLNTKVIIMPSSGGKGTVGYVVLGGAMILTSLAGIVILRRRR